QMRSLIQAFATTRGRQIAMTLAAADPESEFTKAFRNQVILSSREAGRALLLEAAARGEIILQQDLEVLLDMIYGPVFYRLLVGHRSLDTSFADSIVAIALEAVAAPADR
ncbi:TetR/AcrR family transcriptional regulator C-terminal ligand-binding domain-containing protein, partial [Ensifer sp. BRP08]|nr:TetR/AcrR family transcriptional regulator C-terminal ligand-binding domain-containing protein [Ensifer sp. BRP08]